MFEPTLESVIGIDTDNEVIRLYSIKNGDKNSISYYVGSYKAAPFDEEFYRKLETVLKRYREDLPTIPLQKISLILPDSVVLTDTINVPTLSKRTMESSVDVSLSNLYRNSAGIKFNRTIACQNKQFSTYAVVGIRREILSAVNRAFESQQVGISNITYASNAAVDGAFILNPRLKNASFVLLDIKDNYSKIIMVIKGKTFGFYTLPFGRNILYKTRVASEDLLFDHSSADLVVLNAKELARAKALTTMDTVPEASDDDDTPVLVGDGAPTIVAGQYENPAGDEDEEDEDALALPGGGLAAGLQSAKKQPRRLPKFMIRPTPANREGFIYENFRVFVKWTLDFIASNSQIASLDTLEAVYVNMPSEYNFLYNILNEKEKEHGIQFQPLTTSQVQDNIRDNLELFGGFYAKQINKFNNFHYSQFETVKKVPEKVEKPRKKESGNPIANRLNEVLAGFTKKKD